MTIAPTYRSLFQTKSRSRTFGAWMYDHAGWIYIPVSAVLFVGAWELFTDWYHPPSYMLPAPHDVLNALRAGLLVDPNSRTSFIYHLVETLKGTFYGFVVGCTIGIAVGTLISEFEILEKVALPYVVALQSLPKVALAPLIVIWFGFGESSKVAMATLITFFPLVVNCLAGFKSVDAERIELMRSLSANRWQVFRLVKFPSALPFIFAGLNMAIVYALLGTIVAEFVGAQRGIGVLILMLGSVSDTPGVFACLVILGFTGLVLNGIFRAIERRVVFWVYRKEVVPSA